VDTDHFRIFYTLTGEDGIPIVDENGNAIPDFVEDVALAMEEAWRVEVDVLGWNPPPPDEGTGGDDRYDIYLEELIEDGILGYAQGGRPDEMVGNNPNSSSTELYASSSYIGMDNDFIDPIYDSGISPQDWMKVVAAHELLHAIQYGYDAWEPHNWLWEASATWMELVIYPEITETEFYLEAIFKTPDTCQIARGGFEREEDRGHWYSEWLFLDYMAALYGDDLIRRFWSASIRLDGYDALDEILRAEGTTLEDVLRDYTVAVLLRDFPRGNVYPTARLEGIAELDVRFNADHGVGQLAADYVEIRSEGSTRISLSRLNHGVVVGVFGEEADLFNLENGEATIYADKYDYVYLIVLNLERAEERDDCTLADYTVRVEVGEVFQASDKTIQAPNFRAPRVESLSRPH
jgi:hypothetical protein